MNFLPIPRQQVFYQQVWNLARQVPEGKVATYGQLAKMLSPSQVNHILWLILWDSKSNWLASRVGPKNVWLKKKKKKKVINPRDTEDWTAIYSMLQQKYCLV